MARLIKIRPNTSGARNTRERAQYHEGYYGITRGSYGRFEKKFSKAIKRHKKSFRF